MITRLTRVLTDGTDPYENLAREKVLTFHAEPGECILYLWQNRRTVVIGRNQDARRECRLEILEEEGGKLARRLSGGGAVFHDMGNLNFSFCLRREDYDVKRQLSVILQAVQEAGVPAEMTGRNDLTVYGKKFSGNAFFRSGDFCCHHGTLLLSEDTGQMSRYLNVDPKKLKARGVASVQARVGNLQEYAPALGVPEMKKRLLAAFGDVYGLPVLDPEPGRFPEQEVEEARVLFASREWQLGKGYSLPHVMEERFAWGAVRVELREEAGRVTDCRVFSDAMNEDWPRRLEKALRGCAWGPEALAEAARRVPDAAADPAVRREEEQMSADTAEMFRLKFTE